MSSNTINDEDNPFFMWSFKDEPELAITVGDIVLVFINFFYLFRCGLKLKFIIVFGLAK